MKRKCTFLMAAFALLAFLAFPMGMRGQTTVTFTAGTDTGETSVTKDGITVSMSTMSRDDNYRCYANTEMTITSTVGDITNVELTCTASGTASNGPGKFSVTSGYSGTYSYSGTVGTWVGSAEEVSLHASAQVRMTEIVVTYGGAPTITYTVTFDAGEGTFVGNNDFPTTSNTKAAGTYTLPSATRSGYTFDGWLPAGETEPLTDTYTVSDDVDFTAQYTESTTPPGPGPSGDEVTYDFTQIEDFASWTNSYMLHTVTYSDATVTFASASRQTSTITNQPVTKGGDVSLVMTDGSTLSSATFVCTKWTTKAQTITLHYSTNGGETYTSTGITSTNFTITDNNLPVGTNAVKITFSSTSNQVGIASATIVKVGSTPSTDPSIAAGNVNIVYDATSGAIEYTINNPVEGGALTAATNDSWLTLGTVDTTVPFTCAANEGINARIATVTLTYTYGENDETVTKDVTVTQAGNPNVATITVNPTTVNATAEETEGTLTVTYNNITEVLAEVYFCDAEGQTATYDWIEAEIDENNDVYYVIAANDGAARTAYFKVYAIGNNSEDVYSDLVTVNQAAYIAPPTGNTYALYSGELVEDDYVIYYNGSAMKNTVVSNRLSYEEVTPDDDIIVTEDASIVWHIAPSGNYWTIYNVDASAYAAGTGVNNKAQMLADGTDDKALWTVSGSSTYEFVNKFNSAQSVNANLRNNVNTTQNYGFACYSTSTGGALTLYKNTGGIPYVATPTFSPASGSYTEDQEVTISCTTQDAVIYYTTDGSEPTAESDVYAEPIMVTEGITTIKAIAMLDSVSSRVATAVYNINPNLPGSFENPYTVQDAKDNTPSSGYVYVRGIVSEIASSESDVIQYRDISYYISDDGSTANQLFVRYGFNIDSTEFYSLGELQVGDRLVVRGRLENGTTTHSSSSNNPRISAYNYIVSFERDVEPPFFSPGSCMLTNDENAIVYIFSDTYEAEIHYTLDGSVPTMDSPLFDEGDPINLQDSTGTITIKAIAYYEGMHSAVTTATYRMVEPGTPGTMETPYTVQEILDLMDSIPTINQVYVRGIVCTNPIIEEGVYHNANYYISDDGTAGEDNQLFVYRGKGLGGEPITSEDDLRMGDIVTILGDLDIFHNKKEFKQYSIIYEWERPSSITVSSESFDCGEKDGHLNVGYYNIYFQGNPPRVELCDEQGNAAEYDWITVTLNGSELNFHVNAAAEGDVPRTAYLKVIGGDWSGNEVVSDIASITQNECVFAPLPFHYAYYIEGESDTDVVARLDSIPEGLTVYGLGDYYSSYPYLKFDAPDSETGQQDYIELAFNEEPVRLMFDIQGANSFRGGYFYLQTSTNGLDENWNTIAVYTTAEMIAQMGDDNPLKPISEVLSTDNYETKIFDNLSPDIRYIKWIYATRSVGNVRLGGIHLYTPNDLYDIALNQPEFDGCSISADKAIAVEGETVVLSYEFAEDYYLTGWMVTDENGGSVAVNGNQFTMPASNVTVTAEIGWIERYDIVLNQPEFADCSISADKTVAAEGETVTLSYELAEGYYFIEWNVTDENGDPVAVNDNQFDMPASMVTVEAVIVETTTEYQYAYSINGVETEPQTAVVGESITLGDAANIDAFEFIGWTIDPNDIENVIPAEASYTIMEDVTFYAVYSNNMAGYVKVNSTEEITNGNYLIVCEEASAAFNGGLATLDGTNNKINVTIDGGVIAADVVTNSSTFTIDVDNQTLRSASGYYIGVSNNSNGLKQSEEPEVYHNSFAIDENGDALISAVFNGSNMVLRYNATSTQNRFRYYSYNSTQKAIQLYKYVGSDLYTRVFVDNPEGAVAIAGPSVIPSGYVLNVSSVTNELGADRLLIEEGAQLVTSNNVAATIRKAINSYSDDADNFYLISSPVNNVDPVAVGMTSNDFDLYYFDQTATDEEWQNYKMHTFNLTLGMGYLYANSNGGVISLAGTMPGGSIGNPNYDGWHLIGNPYPCNVTINVPYYRLDESGAALVETDSSVAIAPMEAVLVHVEGETIVFTKAPQVSTNGNTGSKVVFNVKP